jgi:hypothetical protein
MVGNGENSHGQLSKTKIQHLHIIAAPVKYRQFWTALIR